MKAFYLEKPAKVENHPLKCRKTKTPIPKSDEVLVKVSACGICRTDLHVCEGELEPRLPKVIPGHQIVGEIIEKGSNVRDFEIGERVGIAWLHKTCGNCVYCLNGKENLCESADFTGWTVNGGFAEYVIASNDYLYEIPLYESDS